MSFGIFRHRFVLVRAWPLAVGLSFLFSAPNAGALDQIVRPYQSARAAGMGGVLCTTGLYEENFFGNPARATANPKWRIDVLNITAEMNSGAIENGGKLTGGGDTI